MVTGEFDEEQQENILGNLKIFAGVKDFPVRVKCATLPWHTMRAALNKQDQVSTEPMSRTWRRCRSVAPISSNASRTELVEDADGHLEARLVAARRG